MCCITGTEATRLDVPANHADPVIHLAGTDTAVEQGAGCCDAGALQSAGANSCARLRVSLTNFVKRLYGNTELKQPTQR
jgi:hypothetical protein